jgi:succinate-acetate transporter protein
MQSYKMALSFVAGAFVGAASWWLSLVGGVTMIKSRISDTIIVKINRILAIFLILAGWYAIITGTFEKPISTLLHSN